MIVRLPAIAALLVLAVGTPAVAQPRPTPAPEASGSFTTWRDGASAVTYDTAAVPAGARARVTIARTTEGVRVDLRATGLRPGHVYGAHLHTSPCGQDPAAAGPHYQHRRDPAAVPGKPSVDPAYANPENEIWLDFTANATGAGRATSTQSWTFDDSRPPWSLVLHAEHTHTAAGEAGTAGARLACLTRPAVKDYGNLPGRG